MWTAQSNQNLREDGQQGQFSTNQPNEAIHSTTTRPNEVKTVEVRPLFLAAVALQILTPNYT